MLHKEKELNKNIVELLIKEIIELKDCLLELVKSNELQRQSNDLQIQSNNLQRQLLEM
jgi:hypothetical protein